MGILYYGAQRTPIPVSDRLLTHLAIVTTTKLRRREGLVLSWSGDRESGGYNTVWIPAEAELHFKFDAQQQAVDRALLETLVLESSKPGGIDVSGVEGLEADATRRTEAGFPVE